MNVLLHDTTRNALQNFIERPSHALLLVAPTGAGKSVIAQFVASQLLQLDESKLAIYPYFKTVQPPNGKTTISIEAIRDLIHFTTLKTTSSNAITRVAIIEDGHQMTLQAQNSLLKTIEEPPAGTTIIITASSERAILPTILSRIQKITVTLPEPQTTLDYFVAQNYSRTTVEKAVLMSGGLPGLTHAMLEADASHPLMAATGLARTILQHSTFERLTMIDDLAKDRQLLLNVLFIMEQMADVALRQGKDDKTVRRWHKILAAAHTAHKQLLASAQPKLTLLNFMLLL